MLRFNLMSLLAAASVVSAPSIGATADTDAPLAARWESVVTHNLEIEDREAIFTATLQGGELPLESVQMVEAARIPCVSVAGKPCHSEPDSLSLQ